MAVHGDLSAKRIQKYSHHHQGTHHGKLLFNFMKTSSRLHILFMLLLLMPPQAFEAHSKSP
jgi:hypothetical protein